MKTPAYLIRIPEPCHEDWNAMQPDAKGKFCGSCSKSVFDFSNKTDVEIHDILMAHRDQKICGHFKKTQVERALNISVHINLLPKNISSAKAFAIALFLVFGTFLFSCTNHQGKKIGEIEIVSEAGDSYTTGLPIMPMTVKGKTVPEVKSLETVICAHEDYVEGKLIYDEIIATRDSLLQDTLPVTEAEPMILGGMEISMVDTSRVDHTDSLFIKTPGKINDQPVFNKPGAGFLVYPNPGTGECTIQYAVLKRADVRVDIFDLGGSWLKTIVNVAGQYEGKYQVSVSLNDLANGIYLVNMLKDGERLTEKLVIEK